MGSLPFRIGKFLRLPGVRPQVLQAQKELADVLAREWPARHNEDQEQRQTQARGKALRVCTTWQQRFELALRSEIPDWTPMAAFRAITDFSVPLDRLRAIFPKHPDQIEADDFPKEIASFEEVWRAYYQYLEEYEARKDQAMHSGKPGLVGAAERHFLDKLTACQPFLGGQAGNILWLACCLGFKPLGYTAYLPADLVKLAGRLERLAALFSIRFENGQGQVGQIARQTAGVRRRGDEQVDAPAGGSMVLARQGRRLIYQFKGMRDLHQAAGTPMAWDSLEFRLSGQPIGPALARAEVKDAGVTWPALPFFCDCWIEDKRLVVELMTPETVETAFRGQVDLAVIGGVDAIFYDNWLKHDRALQARLLRVAIDQLKALTAAGVRLAVELSSPPSAPYLRLLQQLCQDGTITAVGVNGEDELPPITGAATLEKEMPAFWLDDQTTAGWRSEYLTYRRARKLAETLGVRTLYAHSTTIDFILQRDASPGALLRAQLGDMMGKGLVLAALLERAYGPDWLDHPDVHKMPAAIRPKAMGKLGEFALDFEALEGAAGSAARLLNSGYWLAGAGRYALAVVPVMWPPIREKGTSPDLPEKLNTVGSGDMALGALVFLGGV